MVRRLVLSLILSLALASLFSCAIETKRGEEPAPVEETREPVATEPVKTEPKALKKTIIDQDLKKNTEDSELKKRVVVLPLLDRKGIHSEEVLQAANEAFMDALNESGELVAVDSKVLRANLSQYIKNNMYDLKALSQASGKAGVSALLEARIVDMRFQNADESKIDNTSSLKTRPLAFEVVMQVRMIGVRTEQELFNTVKTVVIDDPSSSVPENITADNFFTKNKELTEILLKDALLDYKTKLTDSLRLITWEGRIAALSGDKIYINVGRISGVRLGDILKVVEDGQEIYDTELGYHVGQVQGRVKGTLEVVGFFGQDGAISVIHSGAGFKENDRIEVYQ